MKSNLLFYFLSISLITLFLYSCGTNSNGIFEKRKHVKGWHFHKKTRITASQVNENSKEAFNKNKHINEKGLTFENSNQEIKSNLVYKKTDFIFEPLKNENLLLLKSSKFKSSDIYKVIENKSTTLNSANTVQNSTLKTTSKSKELKASNNQENISDDFQSTSKQWNFHNLFLLTFLAPLFLKGRKSRELQLWAARNKKESRSLLVGLKVALAGSAMGLGYLLETPFSIPGLSTSLAGIGLSYGLWEYWKNQNTLNSKKKIALIGAVNTSTSFAFFTAGGMMSSSSQFSNWSFISGLINNVPEPETTFSTGVTIGNIIAVIMITILLIALLYVIGYFTCVLSCSGQEVAAVIFGVVGSYIVLLLWAFFVMKILGSNQRTNEWYFKRALLYITGLAVVLAVLGLILFGIS